MNLVNEYLVCHALDYLIGFNISPILWRKISSPSKNAPQPYTTSSLQQDASNKLNFRVSHTMKVAKNLYEGVKISDNEVVGLITYMKTDALWISKDALKVSSYNIFCDRTVIFCDQCNYNHEGESQEQAMQITFQSWRKGKANRYCNQNARRGNKDEY